MVTREDMILDYLQFKNNYLSVELWGEHRSLTPEQAHKIIALYRQVFESPHPDE